MADDSPIETALKQIQNWFVNGNFEKVKQGCQEILGVSPNNSIAQDLLKKAEEGLAKKDAGESPPKTPERPEAPTEPAAPETPEAPEAPAETPPETPKEPAPAETPATPEPASEDGAVPSETIKPEPEAPMPETVSTPAENSKEEPPYAPSDLPKPEEKPGEEPLLAPAASDSALGEEIKKGKRSLIINVVILAVIILLGIGGVFVYKALFGTGEKASDSKENVTEEVMEEEITEDEEVMEEDTEEEKVMEEEDTTEEIVELTLEERNKQRKADLEALESALADYYDDNSEYPSANDVNTTLMDGYIDEIPLGPNEDEVYLYAVYETNDGPNQVYVISTLLETKDGEGEVWALGGDIENYDDYDVPDNENVTFLHPTMTEDEYWDYIIDKAFENLDEEEISADEEVMEEEATDETNEEPTEDTGPPRVPRG